MFENGNEMYMFGQWIKVLILLCDVMACEALPWATKEAWQIR
jgi:hypothetical protein